MYVAIHLLLGLCCPGFLPQCAISVSHYRELLQFNGICVINDYIYIYVFDVLCLLNNEVLMTIFVTSLKVFSITCMICSDMIVYLGRVLFIIPGRSVRVLRMRSIELTSWRKKMGLLSAIVLYVGLL